MEEIAFWIMVWAILSFGGTIILAAITPWAILYCLFISCIVVAALLLGADDILDVFDSF